MQDRYPQICVIDVAAVITGKNHDAAAQDFRRMSERYPDVSSKCTDVKFQDSRGRRGQRNTPVTLEQYPDVGTNCSHFRFPPANCLVIDHALVPRTRKWLAC